MLLPCGRGLLLCAVAVLLAQDALGQATEPVCDTGCCETLGQQSMQQCLEYERWGASSSTCQLWQVAIQERCAATCSNCTAITDEAEVQCRFFLASRGLPDSQVQTKCARTRKTFESGRCPAACHINSEVCRQPQAQDCQKVCGVHQTCSFRTLDGTLAAIADSSTGTNVLGEPCEPFDVDPVCWHQQETQTVCGPFKLCPANLCLINDVQCPPRTCQRFGDCSPTEGVCYYSPEPDGTPCDDGLFYTDNDKCYAGICRGTVDLCKQLSITCDSGEDLGFPCLRDGKCLPETGDCVFDKLPPNSACDDQKVFTVEDRCDVQGRCIGKQVDMCLEQGIQCMPLDSCHIAGVCDPATGLCSHPALPDGTPCDDANAQTTNDRCVSGSCVGDKYQGNAYFTEVGPGQCVDRGGRRMRSITEAQPTDGACAAKCRDDYQCVAYEYAYPTCTRFGLLRSEPEGAESHDPGTGAITVEAVLTSKELLSEPAYYCMMKTATKPPAAEEGSALVDIVFGPLGIIVISLMVIVVLVIRRKRRLERRLQEEAEERHKIRRTVTQQARDLKKKKKLLEDKVTQLQQFSPKRQGPPRSSNFEQWKSAKHDPDMVAPDSARDVRSGDMQAWRSSDMGAIQDMPRSSNQLPAAKSGMMRRASAEARGS